MRAFEDLCPDGPPWTVDWGGVREAFEWIRALEGVPQDAVHHAEGDVAVHTRMAASALVDLPEWRALDRAARVRLFATVLLHDVAKPYCTQHTDEGRITAHGHSRRGELIARRVLWEMGTPLETREHVVALVRHHQVRSGRWSATTWNGSRSGSACSRPMWTWRCSRRPTSWAGCAPTRRGWWTG